MAATKDNPKCFVASVLVLALELGPVTAGLVMNNRKSCCGEFMYSFGDERYFPIAYAALLGLELIPMVIWRKMFHHFNPVFGSIISIQFLFYDEKLLGMCMWGVEVISAIASLVILGLRPTFEKGLANDLFIFFNFLVNSIMLATVATFFVGASEAGGVCVIEGRETITDWIFRKNDSLSCGSCDEIDGYCEICDNVTSCFYPFFDI